MALVIGSDTHHGAERFFLGSIIGPTMSKISSIGQRAESALWD